MLETGKQFMQKTVIKPVTNEDLIKYFENAGENLVFRQSRSEKKSQIPRDED